MRSLAAEKFFKREFSVIFKPVTIGEHRCPASQHSNPEAKAAVVIDGVVGLGEHKDS